MRRMPAVVVEAVVVEAAGVEAPGVVAGTPAAARRLAVGSPHERRREERRLKGLLLENLQLVRHRRGGMYVASVRKNAGTCGMNARIAARIGLRIVGVTGMMCVTIVRILSKTDGMIIAVIVVGQLSRPAWP
jgi:hypothetical protein